MIYLNSKEKFDKIKLTKSNFYVISDFDQTITKGTAKGSWGINISRDSDYEQEKNNLYNHYRPIEIDNDIDRDEKFKLMKTWYEDSLNLLLKYDVGEQEIIDTVKTGKFELRDGAKEFFERMNDENIPVLMLSAGIGNVIEEVLKFNNMNFNTMHLHSNFLIFEDGKVKGISDNIIHTMNKNAEVLFNKFGEFTQNRKYSILFGDVLSDVNMAKKENLDDTITIGFLDSKIDENLKYYNETFDIVCTNNTSFIEIMDFLNI